MKQSIKDALADAAQFEMADSLSHMDWAARKLLSGKHSEYDVYWTAVWDAHIAFQTVPALRGEQ